MTFLQLCFLRYAIFYPLDSKLLIFAAGSYSNAPTVQSFNSPLPTSLSRQPKGFWLSLVCRGWGIWTLPGWGGKFESEVSTLSMEYKCEMFKYGGVKGKEFTFVSDWLRKKISMRSVSVSLVNWRKSWLLIFPFLNKLGEAFEHSWEGGGFEQTNLQKFKCWGGCRWGEKGSRLSFKLIKAKFEPYN